MWRFLGCRSHVEGRGQSHSDGATFIQSNGDGKVTPQGDRRGTLVHHGAAFQAAVADGANYRVRSLPPSPSTRR